MKKFRIKIAPSWFSKDYVIIKYTTNGIFWKTINYCERDCINNWYNMVTKTIRFDNAESFLNKFKSLDDIIAFENKERLKAKVENEAITERNRKHKEERNAIYKKFS